MLLRRTLIVFSLIQVFLLPLVGSALFPGLPGPWAGTRQVKPIWILLKQETVSGSSISWAVCKSASHSRQITTPAPHHSLFTGRMPFLPPNQQCQSTEGLLSNLSNGWYFLPDIWKSLHVWICLLQPSACAQVTFWFPLILSMYTRILFSTLMDDDKEEIWKCQLSLGGNLIHRENVLFHAVFLTVYPISWKIHVDNWQNSRKFLRAIYGLGVILQIH